MSIGELMVGEAALSEQQPPSASKKTPPRRQVAAKADAAAQPEAR